MDNTQLSDSYLRIRYKLAPWGSLDTNYGGWDRFEKTEKALDKVLDELKELQFRMKGLEK